MLYSPTVHFVMRSPNHMNWIEGLQILLSILLVTAILLQQRGTGLSSTFGGEGLIFRTKRGIEKALFFLTILFAFLFIGSALFPLIF